MSGFDAQSLRNALRVERLRQGLKLDAIAGETKISRHFLEAIEENQFDYLPGGAYRPTFLRQYAHALGLDKQDILKSFRQQYEAPTKISPEALQRTKLRYLPRVGWALSVVAALLGMHKLSETGPAGSAVEEAVVKQVPSVVLPKLPQLGAAITSTRFQRLLAISVLIGNAGGLIISLNGRAVGPLGPAVRFS
jgi:transcriptional regulator with XRE-family HTH domain